MSRLHTNVFIVVGGRGRGKTTFIKNLAEKSTQPKKLVIDTFKHPAYSGYSSIEVSELHHFSNYAGFYHLGTPDVENYLEEISRCVYNSMLIFEDCLKYIQPNPQPGIRSIALDSKQKANDVFFLYHSWSQVPPKLATWADYLVIFKTQERIENQRARLGGIYHLLEPAYKAVSKSKNHYEVKSIALY